jgi:hypothetical protein
MQADTRRQFEYLNSKGVTRIKDLGQTPHVEDRTPEQIRQRRMAENHRPQPTGKESVNQFKGRFETREARLGKLWGKSPEGQEYKLEMEAESDKWEQDQQAKRDSASFNESIAGLISHAERSHSAVLADKDATVADTEDSALRLSIAKQGDRARYVSLDSQYRDKVAQRLAEQAASVEVTRAGLAQQRDQILASGLDKPEEIPEVKTVMVPVTYPDNYYPDPAKAGKTIMEPMPH